MGHAFGPIVAKPKMRRSIRLEIDFLGLAPGKAPLCDTATLPADRNQLAMNQRLTQQEAELTRKVAIAGAQLAQFGAGKPALNVSHDYDPSAGMEKIEATLRAINAADDERNPPEAGVTAAAIKGHQERPAVFDPCIHRDPRPSHHWKRGALRGAAGTAAERTATHDVVI
jgi:hypothetical protein